MSEKANKFHINILYALIIIAFILLSLIILIISNPNQDKGNYDYCVEWLGFSGGTLHRSNLLYTCYSLSSQTFFCDYKIMKDNRLMIKPILNITKNKEGETIEIIYDEPIYHNCTRWLKSKG